MACKSNEKLGVWRLIYGVFFITCGLIITILNVTTLVVLCRRIMRSFKSYHFLTSLALSDLIMGVLLCPFLAGSCFVSPLVYCMVIKIMSMVFYLVIGSSVSSLAGIAYDRYLLIDPPTYHDQMTRGKVRLILAMSWGVPLLVLLVKVIDYQIYLLVYSIHAALVTIFTVICYRLIIKRIAVLAKARQQRTLQIAKNKKLAHRLFILIVVFGVCMFPIFLGILAVVVSFVARENNLSGTYLDPHSLFLMHFHMLAAGGSVMNSLFNPLVYVFTYPRFKAELRKMLRRLPLIARNGTNRVGVVS